MNQDGMPEYRASLDGTFEALDDNSNGIFEKATLTIREEASIDRNSDGFPEDQSYATVDGVVANAIEEQHPDRCEMHLGATEEQACNCDAVAHETLGRTAGGIAT